MATSIEEMQKTMNETMMSAVSEIDSKFMRKLQADSFTCAANCFSRPNGSPQSDNACSNKCLQTAARATSIVNSSMEAYNRSLANCVQTCNDNVQFSADANESEKERLFFSCASKCVDDFISRKNSVTAQCLKDLHGMNR